MDKYCEYCGNTSGKEDNYGNCKSCGGNLTHRGLPEGKLLLLDYTTPYTGVSGGYSIISNRLLTTVQYMGETLDTNSDILIEVNRVRAIHSMGWINREELLLEMRGLGNYAFHI